MDAFPESPGSLSDPDLLTGEIGKPMPSTESSPFLQELIDSSLVLLEEWEALPPVEREAIRRCTHPHNQLRMLEEARLLTTYQVRRLIAGRRFGLILGNYRVVDRIGGGGMGVVYKGEHIRMRRFVAIKVLTQSSEDMVQLLQRFNSEMRIVGQLQHPNIVGAIDAGEVRHPSPDMPALHYYVMEYVEGTDLEAYVHRHGPLKISKACDLICQVASALAEANAHNLVHRDIKPSNILMTVDGRAKLLDFGLVRQIGHRMTEPGTIMGTIDYLSPEQARDSSTVDIRADIYGLGGTLYWCLTGRTPFEAQPSVSRELIQRMSQTPPSIRAARAEIPAALEEVIARMMAADPDDRYSTPQEVMRALLRVMGQTHEHEAPASHAAPTMAVGKDASTDAQPSVLIIDDALEFGRLCASVLGADGWNAEIALSGEQGLEKARSRPFDLVLLDMRMPGMSGAEVLEQLRAQPPCPNLKVIVTSAHTDSDDIASILRAGANDFLAKPFALPILAGRARAALRSKRAEDRSDRFSLHLMNVNADLERHLSARESDVIHTRNTLVFTLTKLLEYRGETKAHLTRMQRYCRRLAEAAARLPPFARQVDDPFLQVLESGALLHDVGKIALPDSILMHSGQYTAEERLVMQEHTAIGSRVLQEAEGDRLKDSTFLSTAHDICRHHHERFDGTGYPDGLKGLEIPLAARIVALADSYDALRSWRSYRPALCHRAAIEIIENNSPGHFDPELLVAWRDCVEQWEEIYAEVKD